MIEKIPSVTIKLSQDQFLKRMRDWSPMDLETFDLVRKEKNILDVGSDVDAPDGPYRTITGPGEIINRFFGQLG